MINISQVKENIETTYIENLSEEIHLKINKIYKLNDFLDRNIKGKKDGKYLKFICDIANGNKPGTSCLPDLKMTKTCLIEN